MTDTQPQIEVYRFLPVEIHVPFEEGKGVNDAQSLLPAAAVAECEDGSYKALCIEWSGDYSVLEEENTTTVTFEGTAEETELKAKADVTFENVPGEEKKEEKPEELVKYFPLNKVRLKKASKLYENQENMTEYLLSLNPDRLLYNFREAAGIRVTGTEPMTGWDAPECKLKGHTTGHYMSGLALAYAATGNKKLKKRADYMVSELIKVRDAFAKSGKCAPGFISAYDETQFDLLEKLTKYPDIWAPYYTYEKIMSGLFDIYTYTGNRDALKLSKGMGEWVYNRLSKVEKSQRDRMWAMYIAGEYGGMISILCRLYCAVKDEKFLEAAKFFINDRLYYPLLTETDALSGMHANQHIPQITGALWLYRASGEKKYLDIAEYFFETVTGHHIYTFGGTGNEEKFTERDEDTSFLNEKSAESCASYNMCRVAAELYPYSLDTYIMDYYENTLINHLAASADKSASGDTLYFMPAAPGSVKEFDRDENHCCHGTGMESRYRFMENIFAEDGENYYVNLLTDCILEGLLEVTVKEDEKTFKVSVKALSNLKKNVCVRVPYWGVNMLKPTHGSRFASGSFKGGLPSENVLSPMQALYQHPLNKGEELVFTFPASCRIVKTNNKEIVSYAKGQDLMAAVNDSEEMITLEEAKKKLIPMRKINTEHYHLYFKR